MARASVPGWLVVLGLLVALEGMHLQQTYELEPGSFPPSASLDKLQKSADAGDATSKQELADLRKARNDTRDVYCHLTSICPAYRSVRQDCAIAGNFDNCIAVKMGDDKYLAIDGCTEDGNALAYMVPNKPPFYDECFWRNWSR